MFDKSREALADAELSINNNRMKSDYEITYKPVKEKVIENFEEAQTFVTIVEDYIKTKMQ